MRCKCCDSFMESSDLIVNRHTKKDDDLCRRCRSVVFASLLDLDQVDSTEDEADIADVADTLTEVGETWVPPNELT